jgi:hypothetical protein
MGIIIKRLIILMLPYNNVNIIFIIHSTYTADILIS